MSVHQFPANVYQVVNQIREMQHKQELRRAANHYTRELNKSHSIKCAGRIWIKADFVEIFLHRQMMHGGEIVEMVALNVGRYA